MPVACAWVALTFASSCGGAGAAQAPASGVSGATMPASQGPIPGSRAGFRQLVACIKGRGGRVLQTEPRNASAAFVMEGSVQARVGGTAVDLTLVDTTAQARRVELAAAGLAGGSWVAKVPLDRLLGRAGNVVVMYEQVPTASASAAVARCVGGPVRLDAEVAQAYGSAPAHTCTAADRAVFAEFPQYGREAVTLGDDFTDTSLGCSGQLDAHGPPDAVLSYYKRQLRTHGWRILPASGEGSEGGGGQAGELAARRGAYTYAIAFEATDAEHATTHLVLRIGRRDSS